MLEIKNLHVYYGAIHALKGIDFHLDEGEIVALIGANGAGKSTTLNAISGLQRARTGHILFQEEDVSQTPPQKIVRKGIIQVPEGRKIFATLTVLENLEMGAFISNDLCPAGLLTLVINVLDLLNTPVGYQLLLAKPRAIPVFVV